MGEVVINGFNALQNVQMNSEVEPINLVEYKNGNLYVFNLIDDIPYYTTIPKEILRQIYIDMKEMDKENGK